VSSTSSQIYARTGWFKYLNQIKTSFKYLTTEPLFVFGPLVKSMII